MKVRRAEAEANIEESRGAIAPRRGQLTGEIRDAASSSEINPRASGLPASAVIHAVIGTAAQFQPEVGLGSSGEGAGAARSSSAKPYDGSLPCRQFGARDETTAAAWQVGSCDPHAARVGRDPHDESPIIFRDLRRAAHQRQAAPWQRRCRSTCTLSCMKEQLTAEPAPRRAESYDLGEGSVTASAADRPGEKLSLASCHGSQP